MKRLVKEYIAQSRGNRIFEKHGPTRKMKARNLKINRAEYGSTATMTMALKPKPQSYYW